MVESRAALQAAQGGICGQMYATK